MLVTIPAGQLYQLDNTGDEYMILLGARAEPAGNPRFSMTDREVGHGDFAQDNLTRSKRRKRRKRGRGKNRNASVGMIKIPCDSGRGESPSCPRCDLAQENSGVSR